MNIPYKYLAIGLIVSSACMADAKEGTGKYSNAPAAAQFIHNAGQITDQYSKLRSDIDFKIEHGGVVMFGGDGQLHYQWTKTPPAPLKGSDKTSMSGASEHLPLSPFEGGIEDAASSVDIYRMDVTLVGANKNAEVMFDEPTGYYENYYLAHTGENGVVAKGYGKVTYKNVYPGIDWVIYTSPVALKGSDGSQGVKYDFIVHPGGNPADIRLRYDGATELKLVDGALVAVTPFGTITEDAPYSYNATTKTTVTSKYILQDNELRFDVGQYDGTLVIDPALHWATYYTESSNTAMKERISIDNAGNVYLSSYTSSTTNIATTGAFQSTKANNTTAGFLVKFNSNGVRQWGTYYGGNSNNTTLNFYANTVDLNGDIYVGGSCFGAGFATTFAHQPTINNNYAGMLVKFNTSGQRIWATYYGYKLHTYINDICISPYNEVYITGLTQSDSGIATSGTHKTVYTNTNVFTTNRAHAFIAKFDANGMRKWGTYYGDTIFTIAEAINCDNTGKVFLTGRTYDIKNIATQGAHQTAIASTNDGFVAKFDSSGNLTWGTYYGGAGTEFPGNSICDTGGNIYVCGGTTSDTGIASSGSFQSVKNVQNAGYVIKFNGIGQRMWGTYITGNDFVRLHSMTIDKDGNVLVAGYSKADNVATIGSYRWTLKGDSDGLIAKFTLQGGRLYAAYVGGNKSDLILDILTDNTNKIYVCGATTSDSSLATPNAHQTTYNGGSGGAIFLAKLDNTIDTITHISNISKRSVCSGDTIKIAYKITPLGFAGSNSFTAQLSNSAGSFANPANIGSITSISADTIMAVIPANTTTGQGYRIRIASTNPVGYSADSGIVVYAYPTQPVITANTVLCEADTLYLITNNAGQDVQYKWTGPNAFTSYAKDTIIANAGVVASGIYTVVATRAICSIQDTQTVLIKPRPIKPIAGNNTPICGGDTLKLNASTTTTGVTYSWAGPSGFAGTTNDTGITTSTTAMSGDYIVTVLLNGCNTRDTTTVLVKPLPTAVTLSNNGPLCAGDTLHLNATASSTGAAYFWTGTSGVISATKDAVIANASATASGWYKMTVDLNGCIYRDSTLAIINLIPATPTPSYNSPLCIGETLTLNATNISGATYSWTGIGGYTANTQNPTRANMQFGDTGLYNVTATVNGCTSPVGAVRVGINPTPFVVIFANPADSICNGDPVVFTALPNNQGGTPMYQWYVNNAAVSTGSVFNTTALANGDVVRCDMTENTKCSTPYTDASNDINMNILPWLAPSVSFTTNPNRPLEVNEYVTFTATSTNAGASPTYQWKRNGQNVQGATGSVWSANTLNDNDDICVEVISSYKCPQPATAMSSCVKVKVLSGIGDIENDNSIKVYPNPVKGTLRIETSPDLSKGEGMVITISNLLGQQLMQQTVKGNTADVDMSGLAAGVYVVKVNGVYAVRVTKE